MANPVDAVISGVGLESQGLLTLGFNPTGLSLNTFGFLTPCDSIWTPADPAVTTTWIDVPSPISSIEVCID